MSDSNIFNQPNPAATGGDATPHQPAQPNVDALSNLLGSIKNDRGEQKYKDVQTALEALKHSQEFIPALKSEKEKTEAELATLRSEVERLKNLEQTVTELTRSGLPQQQPSAPAITEDVVANLVNATLSAREQAAQKAANTKAVVSALQAVHGAEADKAFYKKAEELGMTADQINSLAAQSPAVVLKLFGLEGKQPTPSSSQPLPSSVNSAGLQPTQHSFIGRNTVSTNVGATTQDLIEEHRASKKMTEELEAKGLTVYDLTDPKEYRKVFGKR